MKSASSFPIFLLVILLNADNNALAFTSATRIRKIDSVTKTANNFHHSNSPRIPSSLNVATIDGSFVFGEDDGFGSIRAVQRATNGGAGAGTAVTTSRILGGNTSILVVILGALLSFLASSKTNALASASKLLRSLSTWYLRRLEMAPLLTKCISGGLIAYFGDYGAQWFEYKSSKKSSLEKNDNSIDDNMNIRTDRASQLVASSPRAGGNANTIIRSSYIGRMQNPFSIQGTYSLRRGIARFLECLLISSPLMHYGYELFESILPVVGGTGLYASLAALGHVVADSVFLDGIFVGTGIVATGVMEGHSLTKHVLPNLKSVYVPTLKASVVTSSALMPLQFLSFRFLPVQLRVLSVNAVDLIWTGVISFVSHSADANA